MSQPSSVASLAGKVAVVLGGTGGIGAACCHRLAEAGARVVVGYHARAEAAAALAAALPGDGHLALGAEITDSAALAALAARVQAEAGRADILVNSAGFTQAVPHGDLEALDDALIDRLFAANWRGAFAAIRCFAPLLRVQGDGLAVTISSISATTGIGSNVAYCAAKAGIDVMTKSLARALAPDIRLVAVSPGAVDTDFVPGRRTEAWIAAQAKSTPLGRVTTSDDVALAVLAAATHLRFTTGSIIEVDGGRHL